MKLLLLDQFSDLGGAQQALLELLPAIRQRGWKATIGLPGSGELFGRVQALGFDTARLACGPYQSGEKSWGDVGRFVIDTPKLAAQVRRLAADVDLVHVNGPRLLPGVALAGISAAVLFQSHSFLPPGRTRALAGAALRRLQASVVAACEFVAAPWREYVPADRVHVIYNGVAGPPAPLWRPAGSAVGCIGRIAPEKGQLEFVKVARLILAALPDVRFFIHGSALFGARAAALYEEQVRRAAAGLPLEFAGWAADVYQALAGLHLLLVPSAGHEATTRVILEAFAAGVPVIALRSGGIPEVIDHGLTGWLADSVEEMAQLAIELLRAPARMAEISQATRHSWEERFTQSRYHRALLARMEQAAAALETAPPKSPP
jgi:glycosyltransferase involved in cell wall biosynthesis